eukprot:1732134-Pleurochrysis_carterae.AAC.1
MKRKAGRMRGFAQSSKSEKTGSASKDEHERMSQEYAVFSTSLLDFSLPTFTAASTSPPITRTVLQAA